ncbi:recombinase family protein [Rhizobium cauense]|uniref:recombinase family protein n=1 Tax=Rhizobium cauense TaxID=1166683 RepID=UPI001C6EA3E6|nr:recombinase family protein [Rhizobium cauense]MBW9116618.1 recombinase family protein [Rhizobium cauense]
MKKQYVTYCRVSTREQSLGLDAQMRDIEHYLASHDHEVLGHFSDKQSGADDDRPEFQKALRLVRKTGAELLVSKLDRLSRDLAMIAKLMKEKDVAFRIASMPGADSMMIGIYAVLAQKEREMISERTKSALAAAKRRGTKLGGYREGALEKANALRTKVADKQAEKFAKIIMPLKQQGMTLTGIAERLNEMGIVTVRGGAWEAKAVSRVLDRLSGAMIRTLVPSL